MKAKDITGQKFGLLTAIRFHDIQKIGSVSKHRWMFLCACGNEYVARKDSFLRGGHSSCGCKGSLHISPGDVFNHWTVVHQDTKNGRRGFVCVCRCMSRSWVSYSDLVAGRSSKCLQCGFKRYESISIGESARRKVYATYKKNAKSRGLDFELNFEEFCLLISDRCYYSGHEPMSVGRPFAGSSAHAAGANILYNGVDRKNNLLGYTKENCVTCCQVCNRAKRAMPYEEWVGWLNSFNYSPKDANKELVR